MRKLSLTWTVLLICGAFAPPQTACAHEGPPFPILVDQPIPGYLVSVWADPDIGEAEFFIILDPTPSAAPASPEGISLWVQPVSERLPKVVYDGVLESETGSLRYVARPSFDAQEMWRVGIEIQLSDGSTHQLTAEVEATPPGPTPWDLLIYLFPFVLFGGLWGFAFLSRMRGGRGGRSSAARSPESPSLVTPASSSSLPVERPPSK